jgi:hypothetical protein
VSPDKPKGTLRIVAMGASEARGFLESPGMDFPSQLAQRLRAHLQSPQCANGDIRRVELLNAALAGMSLQTQRQEVLIRLGRLGADLVVIYPSPAQYFTPLSSHDPAQAAVMSFVSGAELPFANTLQSRVWPRLRDQAKSLTPGFVKRWLWRRHIALVASAQAPDWRFTVVPQDRLAMFEADLRALLVAVRQVGSVPVLGTHANAFMRPGAHDPDKLAQWEHFYARATAETLVAFHAAARSVMIRVAKDMDVTVVDVAGWLATGHGELFTDAVHFTDRGAGIAAEAFAVGILDLLLPQGPCGRESRKALTAGPR